MESFRLVPYFKMPYSSTLTTSRRSRNSKSDSITEKAVVQFELWSGPRETLPAEEKARIRERLIDTMYRNYPLVPVIETQCTAINFASPSKRRFDHQRCQRMARSGDMCPYCAEDRLGYLMNDRPLARVLHQAIAKVRHTHIIAQLKDYNEKE